MDGRFVILAIRDDGKSTVAAMDCCFVTFAIRDDCKSKELKNGTDAPLFYGQG